MVMSDDRLPNFDEDPTIDTVYSLYQRSRADLTPGLKASMERHFDFGIKDIVQPCGYTQSVIEDFIHGYGERQDIGLLIWLLKSHPVYGLPEISDEIIRLLEKTRIKPVSEKTYETDKLHENVKNEFRRIDPKKGMVEFSVPFPRPTSCLCLREGMRCIVVTSARIRVSGDLLQKHPLAGSVISIPLR
jgi:hypothetical protein